MLAAALAPVLLLGACGDDDTATEKLTLRLDPSELSASPAQREQTAEILKERIEAMGLEGSAEPVGDGFEVELEGDEDAIARAPAQLAHQGTFGFYAWEPNLVAGPVTEGEAVQAQTKAPNASIVGYKNRFYVLGGEPVVSLEDVVSAEQNTDPVSGMPGVDLQLTAEGQARFQDLTRAAAAKGERFAVLVGDEVLSLPRVDPQTAPDGISAEKGVQLPVGNIQEAQDLAAFLEIGALPLKLKPAS
jgi:preprotein translocase subunit SecD